MLSIASHAAFFVLLCVATGANMSEPMQGNTNNAETIDSSVVSDAIAAKEAISALMIEAKVISEMREAENAMYQELYKRETQLCDSLLKDAKRSKNLRVVASLQGAIDEALKGVEQAVLIEQSAQRRYEGAMQRMNTRITALGEFTIADAKQASSGPTSATDLQASSSLLIKGDRVKLLSGQPTWNPPLIIGDEGTVLTLLNNADIVQVMFDAGIVGKLLPRHLQKIHNGDVMV